LLKREERWVVVKEGIKVLKEGFFCHWGCERMVKICEGRSRSGFLWLREEDEEREEKGLRRR
jgi:hypothetical protein